MQLTANESQAALPRTIRNLNRRIVIKAAMQHKEFSVADISNEVGLSRQSVMKVLSHFIENGTVVSLGKGASTEIGGKRPELYSIRPAQRCIAILHRTDEMLFRLLDMSANILDSVSISIQKTLDDEAFVRIIRSGAQKLLMRNAGAKEALYGVAMAVGGLVERENHTLYRSMYYSKLSMGLPVREILREVFPMAKVVIVDCIGRMAGQAVLSDMEQFQKQNRIFTLYIDRAITGCFFDKDNLQKDNGLMMIEVGHMVIEPDDKMVCTCGKHGCAEALISIKHIRKEIEDLLPEYPDSGLAAISPELINFEDLFAGCSQGDTLCMQIADHSARVLGQLLRNVFLSCDPGLVVIMGNYSGANEQFDTQLKEAASSTSIYTLRKDAFDIVYEKRDLVTLETLGCAQSLIRSFYDDDDLYA